MIGWVGGNDKGATASPCCLLLLTPSTLLLETLPGRTSKPHGAHCAHAARVTRASSRSLARSLYLVGQVRSGQS